MGTTTMPNERVGELFQELRPLMFSIAYRMLGSVGEAEDVVQEAFLRLHREVGNGISIVSPKAYLSALTTRLSIDQLRSARVQREAYVGPWLPEPLLTDAVPDASEQVEMADSLSLAFLMLLERLSPVERAVFVLREIFGYGYDDVSRIVGKTQANCRQILVRARRQIREGKPRFEASPERRDQLARRFLAAADEGDTAGLIELLADDVVIYGDAGGQVQGFEEPIRGRGRISKMLPYYFQRSKDEGLSWRMAEINGQPGCVWTDEDGELQRVVSLDIADDRVQALRVVANPEKLRHVRRVGRDAGGEGR
jgi:RNA polymerase sigma-70 factor, ECF subfamily